MVSREEVEEIAKRKLKINRVPEQTKKEFIEFADKDFCGDYGMCLKYVWDYFKLFGSFLDGFDAKLDVIMNHLGQAETEEISEEVKLMSGKKIKGGKPK